MKRFIFYLPLLVMFAAIAFGTEARAELFQGETVQFTYYEEDPGIGGGIYYDYGPTTAVVGDGVEFTHVLGCIGGGSCLDVDISDTNILVTMHYNHNNGNPGNFTPWDFNGIRINDLNSQIPDFQSVTINPLTNLAGFNASRVTFDGNTIWANFQGLTGNIDTIVSLDVVGTTAVPEPATMLLFGSGLLGLLGFRRKLRK